MAVASASCRKYCDHPDGPFGEYLCCDGKYSTILATRWTGYFYLFTYSFCVCVRYRYLNLGLLLSLLVNMTFVVMNQGEMWTTVAIEFRDPTLCRGTDVGGMCVGCLRMVLLLVSFVFLLVTSFLGMSLKFILRSTWKIYIYCSL